MPTGRRRSTGRDRRVGEAAQPETQDLQSVHSQALDGSQDVSRPMSSESGTPRAVPASRPRALSAPTACSTDLHSKLRQLEDTMFTLQAGVRTLSQHISPSKNVLSTSNLLSFTFKRVVWCSPINVSQRSLHMLNRDTDMIQSIKNQQTPWLSTCRHILLRALLLRQIAGTFHMHNYTNISTHGTAFNKSVV